MKKYIFLSWMAFFAVLFSSCEKFLDEKADKKLAVPVTLTDLQSMLDNYGTLNHSMPSSGEISADNYYLSDANLNSISQEGLRRMYVWEKDHLFAPGSSSNDWSYLFKSVYVANAVLEGLESHPSTDPDARHLKGQALFFRAFAYHDAAQIWALAYDPVSAATDLGIPLRLNTDFNEESERGSLQETYLQIENDLKQAIPMLPVKALHVVRPSRAAAYGLMARMYLNMRNYERAGAYADSCLQLYSTLMDYNKLNAAAAAPVARFNAEIILERLLNSPSMVLSARIVPELYAQYENNDLRKTILFKKNTDETISFKGGYGGSAAFYGGLTTDEMFLIRAESNARKGNTSAAMSDLNTLLVKRWKAGTFLNLSAPNPQKALELILAERRKELLMRGLRWADLKRFNKEGANITLTRKANGITYTLLPNDLRYALPIPDDVIALSGMTQNYR
ncbi:RagB/SusD family nutrient uptake outer membrane protein [Daejeonella sp. JGW-45]|uniref:RagB/SusD family nutrient uptake outer membrane protein n=1 Tax=Daejeonella sp. JGW-45 TaxID=3034148 RepID=UPI0023ED22F2|nr:RagB/SusD family nutrient uptake outer membrane protein [Daejeonella sp. JGW-45]